MPPLRPFEEIDAGGVDSRSNPVNMPRNRALRCLNWVPKAAGYWEQRWGYSQLNMSTTTPLLGAITGLFPYRTWDGHKYVIFVQGTTFHTIDAATGTVTTPTVKGTAFASSAKGNPYFAANRLHYGNGTDQKWFDGTAWRNNGLRALTASDVQFITISEGVREFTTAQASTVTLTAQATGTFLADTLNGHLMYAAIFDTSVNEVGPATISLGAGRVVVGLNQKITVANLPDLSGVNTNWVKLIGGTPDGSNLAYFFTNTTTNLVSIVPPTSGTISSWSYSSVAVGPSFLVTVTIQTATAHGLSVGNWVTTNLHVFPPFGGGSTVTGVPDGTHYQYQYVSATGGSGSGSDAGDTYQTFVTQVTATAHGLSTGDIIVVSGTVQFNGVYIISSVTTNAFVITLPPGTYSPSGAVGTIGRIVVAANATTSVDVLDPTQGAGYQVNQNRGLPASTIGGPNAGYQFAFSIYNPNGGAHVGNYVVGGQRALQTGYRSNWRLSGLPTFLGEDTEYTLLIGRTGDGAQVPYVAADNDLNWAFAISGQTSFTLTQPALDSQHAMPTRNGVIPSQCSMFCVAGDFAYAADAASPFLRRSGDLSQNTERADTFTGRAEQSWAANDVDTFPTAEACTGIFEIDQEVFMGTLHDCALSVNLAGVQQWNGPWNVGLAGPRAATKCGSNGFYWVTGDKQLATFQQGVPIIVSEEYEAAELSQIPDAVLSQVECVYYRNGPLGKDELRIQTYDPNTGNAYTIIHDFRLRDYQSPGSWMGQGYSARYVGPLLINHTSAAIRDGNGILQIWSGGNDGNLYQHYTRADDAGSQFTSDLILLVNGGPDRPNVPFIDFYGDQNIGITVGRNFQTSLATGAQFGFDPPSADADQPQSVQGAENDFLYRQYLVPPEVQRLYVRFQLTSHSADGTLALNSPPHIPLENYGRLYELVPAIGDERER